MIVVPADTPLTTPPLVIVAIEVDTALHVPPLTVLLSVAVAPVHTLDEPLIVPALAVAVTVKVVEDTADPQVLLTV